MKRTLIHNAILVNEGARKQGSIVIEDGLIAEVLTDGRPLSAPCDDTVDATGCYLLPGVIDEHVHFREPGMTHKADILSESRAAAAGGVTSIMDMPNTVPATTTLEALEQKQQLLDEKCIVNHACYFGATNDNFDLLKKLDRKTVCGIKLFMGSSTGNMLVDDEKTLRRLFEGTDMLIAVHCEDQEIIRENVKKYTRKYGDESRIPVNIHPYIRSSDACLASTMTAFDLARRTGARMHLLHVSTAREMTLFNYDTLDEHKNLTVEVCVGHLLFERKDYRTLGACIKCNPAIKRAADRDELRDYLLTTRIDTIATDHAPHLLTEKVGGALRAASGMPLIQFSLVSVLQLMEEGVLPLETVVEKMCHNPARLFRIDGRGFLREGYKADLVLVRREPWQLTQDCILSKCGWSPLEGRTFDWKVVKTFVNGHQVYDQSTGVDDAWRGEALRFHA